MKSNFKNAQVRTSVMEPETISKNGASPKSQTSRGNCRILAAFALFALCGLNVMAQDIVTLKNGDEIKAKVLEVDIDHIKYKKWDNQTGPNYTLKKTEIFMIKYENGEKDVFETLSKQPKASSASPKADPLTRAKQRQQIYSEYKYFSGKHIKNVGHEKNPAYAGMLSFLIPGLGQFYTGDIAAGFLFLGADIVSLMTMGFGTVNDDIMPIGIACAAVVTGSAIIHAYKMAKRVNLARGYALGNNAYLNVSPAILKSHALAQRSFKDNAYGLALQVSF